MSLIVTGATGQFGRLAVESLLEHGVPAREIVATGRRTGRLKDLADRGVTVRAADYADPASLRAAFEGATRLLLVSGSDPGIRVEQHRNVIEAAQRTGVSLLAYTSIVNAPGSTLRMAADHQASEALLTQSGLPFVLLRNSWYIENYTARLPAVLEQGAIFGSAGDGRVSAATRGDYARAAAAVLTADGHANQAYELGGDTAFTLAELAAEISAQSGTHVRYTDLPEADYARALAHNGVPHAVCGNTRRRRPGTAPRRAAHRQRRLAPPARAAHHPAHRRNRRRAANDDSGAVRPVTADRLTVPGAVFRRAAEIRHIPSSLRARRRADLASAVDRWPGRACGASSCLLPPRRARPSPCSRPERCGAGRSVRLPPRRSAPGC